MNPSMTLLIGACVALLLALMIGFFGYKLARFLLPLSGLAVLEGLIYIYIYDMLTLDALSTWLFFGGTSIAIYLVLFFVNRLGGFFTGLLGSGLLIIYVVKVLNFSGFSLINPIALTLCVMAALLTAAYKRVGVIISTSILGGCMASYLGLYIYLQGVDTAAFMGTNLLTPIESFLGAHALLVLGVGIGLTLVSLLVQFGVTGKRQVLGDSIGDGLESKTKSKKKTSDPDIWTGDMGY